MYDYFLDIPVYRCSKEKYNVEFGILKKIKLQEIESFKHSAPLCFNNFKNNIEENIPWRFNEIIGWISLYYLGSQIRGDLFFVSNKRIQKSICKKCYRYVRKVFELYIFKDDNSVTIYENIRNELIKSNSISPLKKRYIDLQFFDLIGKHILWNDIK